MCVLNILHDNYCKGNYILYNGKICIEMEFILLRRKAVFHRFNTIQFSFIVYKQGDVEMERFRKSFSPFPRESILFYIFRL